MDLIKFRTGTGVVHNLGLDAITQLPGFPNISLNDAILSGKQTLEQVYYETYVYNQTDYTTAKGYAANLVAGTPASTVSTNALNDGNITADFKTQADNLIAAIDSTTDYVTLETAMDAFVSALPGTSSLTDDEKIILNQGAGLALLSAKYWSNVYNDPTNYYHGPAYGLLNGTPWWERTLRYVGVDVATFIFTSWATPPIAIPVSLGASAVAAID